MVTNERYANIATELLEIFKYFEKANRKKIPKKFKEGLEAYSNKEYKFYIDKTKTLKEQKILPETKQILANIYVEYLYPEEKAEIQKIWKENELKLEEEKRKKYDPDNLFKKKNIIAETNTENNMLLKIEDKWYKKVIFKLRNLVKMLLKK